jgi:hypothetical protein
MHRTQTSPEMTTKSLRKSLDKKPSQDTLRRIDEREERQLEGTFGRDLPPPAESSFSKGRKKMTTTTKTKKQTLSEKVRAERFYTLFDENLKLKKHQTTTDDEIKKYLSSLLK